MNRVTLYTKPGCHLCEAVEQVIARVRKTKPFELEVRNILDDADDFVKYQYEVPVVFVDGREVSRYRLTTAQLDAALAQITIVVMAKAPVAGKVKTRLMPQLTAEQAADVHRVFLQHVTNRLRATNRMVVCYDPPEAQAAMRQIVDTALMPQSAGDLGARLAAASHAIPGDVLFFGVDSPDVPTTFIARAIDLLRHNDVVVGPTDDGGYWCLGLGKSVNAGELLATIEWSTGREFEQTIGRGREMGYAVALADRWDDVDRPEDLRRLVSRLNKSDNETDMRLLQDLIAVVPTVAPHGGLS